MADLIMMPKVGLIAFAERCVKVASPNLYMDLYVNDVDYNADDVANTFTLMNTDNDEEGNPGYLQHTLAAGTWGTGSWSGGQGISVYGSTEVFVFDTSTLANVYGYVVRDQAAAGGNVMWACYFESAKPIQYSSETISVTPTFKFGQ